MDVAVIGVFIPIVAILGTFFMVVALQYIKYKDRQSLIEKGIDPGPMDLRWKGSKNPGGLPVQLGLTAIGIGLGLLSAFLITRLSQFQGDDDPIYFGFIAFFGGMGLLISYFLLKKEAKSNPENPEQ